MYIHILFFLYIVSKVKLGSLISLININEVILPNNFAQRTECASYFLLAISVGVIYYYAINYIAL